MQLDPIGALFANSWKRFEERFTVTVEIFAVPAALIVLSKLLFAHMTPAAFGLGAIVYLVSIVVSIIASLALISAFGKNTNFAESYGTGIKLFWPGIWIAILVLLATLGGLIMLIIPGIILMVQLGFSNYVLVIDNKRGMGAIAQSRAYVKGHWWAIVGRILLLTLIFIVAGIVILAPLTLLLGKIFGAILYGIFIVFITPFAVSYQYELFHNLRRLKPHVATEVAKSDSSFLKVAMVVGIIGAVLIPVLVIEAIALWGPNFDNTSPGGPNDNGGYPTGYFNPGGPMQPVQPEPQSQPLE